MKKINIFSKILLIILIFMTFSNLKAQEYIQTTFTATGNHVTVKFKSSAPISGVFTNFSVSFRCLESYGINFVVTSNNFNTVSMTQSIQDPITPTYHNYQFGFTGGTSTQTFDADVEYTVFTFDVVGGTSTGTIGLIEDLTDYTYCPFYCFNRTITVIGNDYTNYTSPFYFNPLYSTLIEQPFNDGYQDWLYWTLDLNIGKFWKTDAATTTWSSASNWSDNSVPLGTDNITIYSGPNQPVAGTGSVCNKLQIETGATVEVPSNGSLTVNGDLSVADNNALMVKSAVGGTGSLITNGTVPGANKVSLECYIANNNSWHFLSSPVAAQSITTGFAPSSMNTTFDFYKWDETVDMNLGSPWINLRATPTEFNLGFGSSFEVGRGYMVAYDGSWGINHSFAGTLNNGDKSITVTKSTNNQFNLIGNPYASAIDWTSASWGTNRNATLGATPDIWIWNQNAGNYGTIYGPLNVNGASNIIAPNQGFFVQALVAGGTFTMPNAVRVHGSQAFLKTTPADLVKLHVSSTLNTYSDEIVVNFNSNATSNEGVAKWFSMVSGAPSLYSVKNNANLSINTLPTITINVIVPVGFKAGVNGLYSINATSLNSFSTTTYVYLKDLTSNTITNLNQNPSYSFTATTTDNANRFQLIFATTALAISEQVNEVTGIYSYDNTITINSNENMKEIAIYNTLGQLIKTIGTSNGTVKVDMNGNPMGYYIVKVITDKNVYSEKVLVK